MDSISLFLLALLAGAGLCALLLRGRTARPPPLAESDVRSEIRVLAERLHGETAFLAQRVEALDRRMVSAQDNSTHLASSIFDRLGDVDRATHTIAEQAREFVALQDLLRPPKARGGLGEALLEELLRQVLPPHAYSMQHRFTSGVIVDAIVKAGDRIVCVDSKFPLANYNKMCDADGDIDRGKAERDFAADVDRHIRDISSKYIVPDEGTFDFAVMYVPAEGVYGEVLRMKHRKQSLFESAMQARVVPMSPLTMYGYLQTVLFGLKCLSIEKNAEAVLGHCGRLQQDIERFASEYDTLGRHLGNARSKYEEGARRLDRFRDKLDDVVQLSDDTDEQRDVTGSDAVPLEVIGE
jgi:DNA recombination protein RmuC